MIPHLKEEYFEGSHKLLFAEICDFVSKYNVLPTKEPLLVDVVASPRISVDEVDSVAGLVEDVFKESEKIDFNWLINSTEKWAQDAAIRNAVFEAVAILDGKDLRGRQAIPSIMQDALAVTFDHRLGHNYFKDAESRWQSYRDRPSKIPFHLPILNEITDGGYERKTLNAFLGGIHVGKTLALCSVAAGALEAGFKVLHVTLEDGEEKIAKRIDANLINRDINTLHEMDKQVFLEKIEKLRAKVQSDLIIRQYPAAGIHVGHIRGLLEDLRIREKFVPDVIIIDYLNLMLSARARKNAGLYEIVKAVAEEIRGLAVEYNVAIWTATQVNRSGMESSDVDMTNTSESIGLPATLDFFAYIGQPDAFKEAGQYFFKQLKNRYKNLSFRERLVLGVDKDHQRLFEVEDDAQGGLITSTGSVTTARASAKKADNFTPDYSGFNFGDD